MPARAHSRTRLLLVDDDADMLETLSDGLVDRGYAISVARSGEAALSALSEARVDLLVTDIRMRGIDGLTLLERARAIQADLPVIVMTAYSDLDTAIEAVRRGAYHYLAKPFRLDELALFVRRALDEVRLRREADTLRRPIGQQPSPAGLLGRSAAMQEVYRILERVADTSASVLVTGETGTGKSLFASILHARSGRASAPLVAVNCAALPEALLESELFGHVRGAFSGATHDAIGLFVAADGGTLFLDEIGEMPLALQAKLLHVLERKTVRPLGGTRERSVDVRIVAATNRDLDAAVQRGTFREDLLYRLNLVTVELPPLRRREGDVVELVSFFLQQAGTRYPDSPVRSISRDAMRHLLAHPWPGNIRELAQTVERLVLLGSSPIVDVEDLPSTVRAERPADVAAGTFASIVPMREMQRRYAAWVLEQAAGVRARAARDLGIDVKTLAKLLDSDGEASPERTTIPPKPPRSG